LSCARYRLGANPDWEPIPDDVYAEIAAQRDPDYDDQLGLQLIGPDALITRSLDLPLGPDAFALLTHTDYDVLTEAGLALALRQLESLSAHIDAEKSRLIAVIAGPEPASVAARRNDFSPQDVAVATKCSVYAADAKIALARELASRFTASAMAMRHAPSPWRKPAPCPNQLLISTTTSPARSKRRC
jgi:hypothetical protein